jgi:hypothetical protein
MKQRQRAYLCSIEKKRNTARWNADVDRRRGITREKKGGDDVSWADANLTGPKNKKKYEVDSASINGR